MAFKTIPYLGSKSERGGEKRKAPFVQHMEVITRSDMSEDNEDCLCVILSPSEEIDHSVCSKELESEPVYVRE